MDAKGGTALMGVAFKGHLEVARYLAGERGGARDSRAAGQDCLPIPLQFYSISNAGRMPEWPASDQGVAHGQAASNTDQTIYASPANAFNNLLAATPVRGSRATVAGLPHEAPVRPPREQY